MTDLPAWTFPVERVKARDARGPMGVRWHGPEPVQPIIKPLIALRLIGRMPLGLVDSFCVLCGNVTRCIDVLCGQPEDLCPQCAWSIEEQEADHKAKTPRVEVGDAYWLSKRVDQCGLRDAVGVMATLGVTPQTPLGVEPAPKGRFAPALRATLAYLAAPGGHRPLILCGPTGVGKTTASAWAVWKGHGLFLSAMTWRSIPNWNMQQSLAHIIDCRGPVVIDNCLDVRADGTPKDSAQHTDVLHMLVIERDEARRPTILTTQAAETEIAASYAMAGQTILRRALDGAKDLAGGASAGGVVSCWPTVGAKK